MISEDGTLDEIVFGPPAHPETPHDHTHLASQEPVPGALHDHHHFHPGGWSDSSVHHHRHVHPVTAEGTPLSRVTV
jgi:hypothetical protein